MKRPQYEALDGIGLPYLRDARTIGELPTEMRKGALVEATESIAARTGLKSVRAIQAGTPVFCAFEGMTRQKAKHHVDAELLMTQGNDVPLDNCPTYAQETEPA